MPPVAAPIIPTPQAPPPPNPLDEAKMKIADGKLLTFAEANMVKQQPIKSISQPEGQKLVPGVIPAASIAPINEIDPGVPQVIGMRAKIGQSGSMADLKAPGIATAMGMGPSLAGRPISPGQAPGGKAPVPIGSEDMYRPAPKGPAKDIQSRPITPVNKPGPEPVVSTALVGAATAKGGPDAAVKAQEVLNTPLAPEDTAKALNAVQKYLAENPDRFTLANVLDSVGVALSAWGGNNRQTKLQKDEELKRQYALQQGSQAGEFKNATALKGQDLANAIELKKQDLVNQSALLQQELANALATGNQQYASQIKNRLVEIEAQMKADITREKTVRGINTNLPGLVNKYSGAPQ